MRRHALTTPALRAVLALGVVLQACASTTSVDGIVASNLAARGGADRIVALRSIRETGTATASGGRVARVVRELKRPGLFRLEFTTEGTTSVFAHDGSTGWQVAPLQGQFEPRVMPPDSDAAGQPDQRDIEGPLVNWRAKGNTVELVGREMLPGGEAFKLKVALKGGQVRYDWVDVASRQVVRSDVTRVVKGHRERLENTFSEFRPEGGLVFPHRIDTRVEGRPEVVTIVVDKVELDPDLDDALFRFPRE